MQGKLGTQVVRGWQLTKLPNDMVWPYRFGCLWNNFFKSVKTHFSFLTAPQTLAAGSNHLNTWDVLRRLLWIISFSVFVKSINGLYIWRINYYHKIMAQMN
jgi:hypothetical protein